MHSCLQQQQHRQLLAAAPLHTHCSVHASSRASSRSRAPRAAATTAALPQQHQQHADLSSLPHGQQHHHHQQPEQQQQQQQPEHQAIDWLASWYPIGFVRDFDASQPHRFVLLGIPLVIWWDPTASSSTTSSDGGWRVFADACPHRLVPLSEGRVTPAGRLECPYHGWQFDAAGTCEVIPQEGNLHTPRACAIAFPCVVRQGLLFVKPQPLPKAPLARAAGSGSGAAATALNGNSSSLRGAADAYADVPTIPELDQEGWVSQDTWRDVPYDFTSLLENVLDASHVPFTHHKSISNRNIRSDYSGMHLTQPVSQAGFSGLWPSGPRGGALGPQETHFRPPCLMTHKIVSKSRGFESMVVVYAVPVAPGRCRLLNRNTFKFSKGGGLARAVMKLVPGWAVHMGTQVPLEDDQVFLHIGELQYVAARQQGKTAAQAYYLPSKADTYITAFRRWLASYGGGGPFGDACTPGYLEQIGERQSREQLLDRFAQHTANCAQCSAALQRIRSARKWLTWVVGIAASLALLTAAVAASSSVAAATAATAQAGGLAGHIVQGASALLLAAAGVGGAQAAGVTVAQPLISRLAVWLGVAGFSWLVQQQLGQVEGKLLHGDYPPPRNTDKA